jgi:membrane protease YdiL (CAAX protease family)
MESPSPGGSTSRGDRAAPAGLRGTRTLLFLLVIYAALQAYLWLVVPTRSTPAIAAGAILILAVMIGDPWRRGESASSVGLTFRHFAGAMKLLALPTAASILLFLLVDRLTPDAPAGGRFLKRFVQILPWALLQQGLLQATFNRRLAASHGKGWTTSLVNGLFFAGMHLPGPLLTGLTFVAGTVWSWVYQRKPNLLALVLAHALLSAAAQDLLPSAWTHGFRVGPGYFRYSTADVQNRR